MTVTTDGGRLDLLRGGPAQEFTVTLRNGNTRSYEHLLPVFQLEILVDDVLASERPPQDGFVLERWDHAARTWRVEPLRIANDVLDHSAYRGGRALARDAVRVERYRLRALGSGPAGSTPLMMSLVDTDAPAGASLQRVRPAYVSLPHTTRRN
ncbi:hypothetical protein ABZ958_07560 [Streptomyces sp. NPDC046237]|uniref:hypothetical protein n=1 Tax=Streptomyces sp. NPDC046237 TaxID=3154914 RepID=UPI003407AFC8